jgi:hypothetical protein
VARAIAKLTVAIALVAAGGCKGAEAPTTHAPIEEVSIAHAGSTSSSAPVADNAPVEDDAGAVPVASETETQTETGTAELVVGDKSHHEKLRLPIRGFYRIHDAPTVTVTQKGMTHDVQFIPPFRKSYFLNGVQKPSGLPSGCISYCESVASHGVTIIDLVDYVEDGMHPGSDGDALPVFRTIDLKGTIDIRFDYFADSKCTVKRVFKKTLKR